MSSAEATTRWARAFVDELARCGVEEVVVAPGSRSTPLVLAFAADGRFRTRVHLDERSAGFFALGVGRASAMPAALVTTSGTATANLYPAVMEAFQAEVPLLVLTADRPHRHRDADANQAVDQLRLYGAFTRAFFDAAPPALDGPGLRHLRGVAARAVLTAREAPAGPVHVNFPFDKPLEPGASSHEGDAFEAAHPVAAAGRPGGEAFVRTSPARRALGDEDRRRLHEYLEASTRGVVVAGPSADPARSGAAARSLSARTGFPLLADPLSGARFGDPDGARVVDGYDLFLRDGRVRDRLTPDLVLRVGASPTSASLQGWLEHHSGVRHVVVDGGGRWKDHGALATDYIRADAADTLLALAGGANPSKVEGGWVAAWATASAAARDTLGRVGAGHDYEGRILADVVAAMPSGAGLFVSSSMPVRDLDAFGLSRPEALSVWGNRGVSGIDGIVSSAFGVSAASGAPTVCVLGDVAFFHDLNGLLWSRESDAPVVFVLVDNDGGGIFHMLPVRDHEPHFSRFFATPHGLDFRHAASLHGIPFRDVGAEEVGTAVGSALRSGGSHILRVRTDRAASQGRRREIADAVAAAVREALA